MIYLLLWVHYIFRKGSVFVDYQIQILPPKSNSSLFSVLKSLKDDIATWNELQPVLEIGKVDINRTISNSLPYIGTGRYMYG